MKRAYENVAFYKRVFDRLEISPEDIKLLGDLSQLPFITRDDLLADTHMICLLSH